MIKTSYDFDQAILPVGASLKTNILLRFRADRESHLLIGSLGSFGFTEASRLSREIEQIFRAEVERLEQLVVALRQELERSSITSEPPAPGSTTVKQ